MASSFRNKDCLIGYSFLTYMFCYCFKIAYRMLYLARFMGIQEENKDHHIYIFREVLAELKVVWERAGVPIKTNSNCVNDEKFHNADL
jgi:hypothetical protein